MLSKLILLNAAKFSKVSLDFEQTIDTVQLVGGNRYGKTSLLNALNFLFVPDARQLNTLFGDHTLSETLKYYFPKENQSFILYQIYKNGYFTILVKTNNGKLNYYKFNQAYHDDFFFNEHNQLLKFNEIKGNFLASGIELREFDQIQDYFQFAYSRERKNNECVVWLDKNVKSKGINNPFTEMYKCLVKPKLINDETLKLALITADNKNERYDLTFSNEKSTQLNKLHRLQNEVNQIKDIQEEFSLFKKLVSDYNDKQNVINELYYSFGILYETEMLSLKSKLKEFGVQIQSAENMIKHTFSPEKKRLGEQHSTNAGNRQSYKNNLKNLKDKWNEIQRVEPLPFLEAQLSNLSVQWEDLNFKLQQLDRGKASKISLDAKIQQYNKDILHLQNLISGDANLLIQNISSDTLTSQLLNRILSEDIKRLPATTILEQSSSITQQVLRLAGGAIDISSIKPQPFKTIEELKITLKENQDHLDKTNQLLHILEERQKFDNELANIKKNIQSIEKKIELLNQSSTIQSQLKQTEADITQLGKEMEGLETEMEAIEKKIEDKNTFIDKQKFLKEKSGDRERELSDKNEKLKFYNISPKQNASQLDDIDEITAQLFRLIGEVEDLRRRKDSRLNDLKKRSSKDLTEIFFLQEVEEDIATLQQKENTIDEILQNIAQSFSNPADSLLKAFQEFRESFIVSFNTRLAKIQISDIQSIRLEVNETQDLIRNIEKIRDIRQLNSKDLFSQVNHLDSSLSILKQWLNQEKKIAFHELFGIKARIVVEGKERTIDFSKEIESGGTNRMLKFILFLSIIKKLVVDHAFNRIPFCIDETLMIDTQNQDEILRFCKINHFFPILAAPDPVKSKIDRFYYLLPNAKGDKMFVLNAHKK